jgi:hypothetical protein
VALGGSGAVSGGRGHILGHSECGRRILRTMPVPPDGAWQLPWLRLHLFMRDVLAVPWGKDWPIVKRELARCAELRRAMIQAGWFN